MSRILLAALALFVSLPGNGALKESPASLTEVRSRYTELMLEIQRQWPLKTIAYSKENSSPVQIECYLDSEDEFYIGASQVMEIQGSLDRVAAVVEDIDHYKDIFPGLRETKLVSRDGNRWLTFWEQIIPTPFVPNVKYEMWYWVDASRKERKVYRYQLKGGDDRLKASDGMIVIDKVGDALTRYTEFDFFSAEYGILKTLMPRKIWRDAIEGFFLSDLGVKLKVEHSEWKPEQITEKASEVLKQFPVDAAIAGRSNFYKLAIKPK